MTVENISITVKTNADRASAKLESLASALDKVSAAAGGLNSNDLTALANAVNVISGSKVSVGIFNSLATGVTRLGTALKSISAEDAITLDQVVNSIAKLQGVNLNGQLGQAGQAIRGAVSAADSATTSVRNVGTAASKSTHSTFSLASALKSIGTSAKSSSGSVGKLFASIKRIAMYRLLRTALKEISQAFKEGLKNAYNFSKGIGGSLASSLDNIATKSLTMKNQLGAAFGSLLETIAPILLQIISLVQQAANAISMLFAAFGGGDYLVAKDVATEWDKATGAAKKYKNTILGFDEINRLNDETGGGGGASLDASNMFEVGQIPEALTNFVDTVKSLIAHENWATLGQFIAAKINEAIKSIDLWSVAETVGQKINGAITAAFNFLKSLDVRGMSANIFAAISHALNQIDFHNLGGIVARKFTMLGDLILGMLEGVDWSGLGKAVGDFFRGIFDHISEWLDTIDWKQAGKDLFNAIKNFLLGIDFKSLATSFWTALKKAINSAFSLVGGFLDEATKWMNEQDWYQIASDFYTELKSALEGIDFASIAQSVFTFLGTALASAVKFVAQFISDVIDDIAGYFKQFIEDENNDGMFSGGEIIKGVFKGIVEALKNVGQWIFDNIVKPFIDAFEKAFGIASPAKEMEGPGENVGLGILAGILKPFKEIYDWIKENIFDPFVKGFKSAFGMEGDGESVTFKNLGEKIVEGLQSGFKAMWDTFVGNVQTWWNNLKTWFEGLSLNLSVKGTTVNENGFSHSSGKFAAEGGLFPNTGTLIWAGEAGPEIVANVGSSTGVMNVRQMEDAVANGNTGVINAIYGMANMIVKAVESIDTDVVLDGESMADAMYYYNKQAANRHGSAMVSFG